MSILVTVFEATAGIEKSESYSTEYWSITSILPLGPGTNNSVRLATFINRGLPEVRSCFDLFSSQCSRYEHLEVHRQYTVSYIDVSGGGLECSAI